MLMAVSLPVLVSPELLDVRVDVLIGLERSGLMDPPMRALGRVQWLS
jgi:hypothetical protein